MGHDHDHGVGLARAGERHRGRLAIAFGLTFAFFFVQAAAGVIANSLALLSDACLLYTSPSPRDRQKSRMPSSA